MQDNMQDMLLVVTIPISIILTATIYKIIDIYLDTKDDCKHIFSRWSDIKVGDGHPYQIRNCNKCNLHQSRTVQ